MKQVVVVIHVMKVRIVANLKKYTGMNTLKSDVQLFLKNSVMFSYIGYLGRKY
jgi:hypothetical protein